MLEMSGETRFSSILAEGCFLEVRGVNLALLVSYTFIPAHAETFFKLFTFGHFIIISIPPTPTYYSFSMKKEKE